MPFEPLRPFALAVLGAVLGCTGRPSRVATAPAIETSGHATAPSEPVGSAEPEPSSTPSAPEPVVEEAKTRALPIDVGAPEGSPPGPDRHEATARFRARLQLALRRCYERALKFDPSLRGALAVRLRIDVQGRVTEVKVTSEPELNTNLVQCIAAGSRAVVLQPPPSVPLTLEFPVNVDSVR